MPDATLPKTQRLHGTTAATRLFRCGKGLSAGCLRCKYLPQDSPDAPSRMMVSVPKRSFKRAVKRNLLKRRIREAYRRQKGLLGPGMDVLFLYASAEILPYEAIFADMTAVLNAIAAAHE